MINNNLLLIGLSVLTLICLYLIYVNIQNTRRMDHFDSKYNKLSNMVNNTMVEFKRGLTSMLPPPPHQLDQVSPHQSENSSPEPSTLNIQYRKFSPSEPDDFSLSGDDQKKIAQLAEMENNSNLDLDEFDDQEIDQEMDFDNHHQLKEQAEDQLEEQVENQVEDQLENQLEEQVENQAEDQLEDQLEDQVEDQMVINDQIRNEVKAQVEDEQNQNDESDSQSDDDNDPDDNDDNDDDNDDSDDQDQSGNSEDPVYTLDQLTSMKYAEVLHIAKELKTGNGGAKEKLIKRILAVQKRGQHEINL
jgi:hypothetical protein